MRRLPAYIIHAPTGKYLIFKNNASGKRDRYDVLLLDCERVWWVGRELTLGHCKRLCK